MYATAKHKLPADSLGSSLALWPAVLAQKAVFLLLLHCVVGNTGGETPAQLLHVSDEQILNALSFLPGKLGHSGVGVSMVMVHLSSVGLTLRNRPVH